MGFIELLLESTVVQNIGTFAIASGLFVWLFKTIYKQTLDKEMQVFMHKLKLEEAQHSKLYDKRGQVIEELYKRLDTLYTELDLLVKPIRMKKLSRKDSLNRVHKAGERFEEYFHQHKIYFSKDVSKLLEEIHKKLLLAMLDYDAYPQNDERDESREQRKTRREGWLRAWSAMKATIPPIKEKLEDEFRAILGTK